MPKKDTNKRKPRPVPLALDDATLAGLDHAAVLGGWTRAGAARMAVRFALCYPPTRWAWEIEDYAAERAAMTEGADE